MKKSSSPINMGIAVILGLSLCSACHRAKTNENAAVTASPPPVQTLEVKPVTGSGNTSGEKAGQSARPAPMHGSPNQGQLDSLRDAMDKLREKEEAKKSEEEDIQNSLRKVLQVRSLVVRARKNMGRLGCRGDPSLFWLTAQAASHELIWPCQEKNKAKFCQFAG
jgi:hypothetical protein